MVKTNAGRLLTQDILSDIKVTAIRAKEEYQKKLEQNSREKVYERLLIEAELLIRKTWLSDAKKDTKIKDLSDSIEVEANGVFCITENLRIYAEQGYAVFNPDTGCCCFYDSFTFESEKERDEYIRTVMGRLPEGTVCEISNYINDFGEHSLRYTFKLKVNIK